MSTLIRSTLFSASLLITTYASAFEALPDMPPAPPDNPMSPAKVQLGMQLFFDPRLSVDGTVSCNTCHNVMSNGTDNRPVSIGVRGQKGGRSAPTVWNAAYLSVQFWDGRASSLEEQAQGPVLNPIEMGMPHKDLAVNRIASIAGYREQFTSIFSGDKPVSYDNIAKAIASYERTLITPNSPYDQYAKGNHDALSAQAKRGLDLVQSFGCTSCHNGPVFAGPALPVGEGFFQKFPVYPGSKYESQYGLTKDLGRYEVTKKAEDKNVWRVPTWRNIALTAPYFHNGSVATLDEAIRVMAKTQLNKTISDEDTRSILAFLESLTGEFPTQQMPRLPDTSGATVLSSVE